ncbi:hypothetical protein STCU_10251 [Strigomonas culicis]|uniref:Uncharacterized protein n=1 Tax=Strigomonas culicis TaxID=28005 RepID=S9TNQ3_9TRYP|nr:hypothetical protein STCU_10251 [Strigomonas culicis]|eukprot:EPY18018.1 hypothetical protein STCU_10251 [Strigomonas culicis]
MSAFSHLSRHDNDNSECGTASHATANRPAFRGRRGRFRVECVALPVFHDYSGDESSTEEEDAPIATFQVKCRPSVLPPPGCDVGLTSESSGSADIGAVGARPQEPKAILMDDETPQRRLSEAVRMNATPRSQHSRMKVPRLPPTFINNFFCDRDV